MKNTNNQHVQLPNELGEIKFINPKDQLVYTAIRKFMNKDTYEAYPSLDTIHKLTGIYVGGIRKCVDNLVKSQFLEVRKDKGRNIYKFTQPDKFEPFSYEFLEKQDLTTNEKAYLVATQQFMFKEDGKGFVQMSEQEIANRINMSKSEVNRVNNSLIKKEYLHVEPIPNNAGDLINKRVYDLNKLGQAIIFVLKKHEDDINDLKRKYAELEEKIARLEKNSAVDSVLMN